MTIAKDISIVTLGDKIDLQKFMAVARYGATVEFSDQYKARVSKARNLVENGSMKNELCTE